MLRWHFRVLLEQWECDTVRHRHDKNAELGYFYGHTDEQNIYFGHTGRCRVHYEYNPESYPSVNVRGQDKFSETLPEPGDVIYCGYVFKNRPCWFLARDYPGLHEMLTWLRTATGKKVPKFDWVSVYLSEHVSKTLTWRYLMERN